MEVSESLFVKKIASSFTEIKEGVAPKRSRFDSLYSN